MKPIRSFVRRNGRKTEAQANYLSMSTPVRDMSRLDQIDDQTYIGLEIGFGMGDSLVDVASKHAEQFWVGVEVFHAGIASVVQACTKYDLTNILVTEGDIDMMLDDTFANRNFDHIRIFFPDPWPKKRHNKRRLVKQGFVDKLISHLKVGGIIHFASDNASYAEEVKLIVENSADLSFIDSPERPLTKYAKKALAKGDEITDVAMIKT